MKSLYALNEPLSSERVQLLELAISSSWNNGAASFAAHLTKTNLFPLKPIKLEVFQLNLGKMCNQVCKHCHVDAGPDRKEIMTREVIDLCLLAIDQSQVHTADLTGGAPEMNPEFRYLVEQLSQRKIKVIVRCNLTIIMANKKYHDLPAFFRKNKVEVVSSLPFYTSAKTDSQRGDGVFKSSIEALKLLNKEGYGIEGSGLILNLVYNPAGAFLPPEQHALEKEFKQRLSTSYQISFNNLFTITNLPVSRFLDYLVKTQNFDSLPDTPCIAETPVKIKKEISILLARNINGEIAFFPATEMIFEESANLLLFQTCPADISNYVELEAQYYAERIATELEIVGLLAVEFFLTDEDRLVVNEVAPRPHNSGHHTIEACDTSQFEQHLRAILNFPLGSTELRKPAALLNLLGAEGFSGEPIYKNYGLILKIDDAHLHLYGKQTTKPFRKMGHLTVLNDDVKKALEIVKKIHQQISCES